MKKADREALRVRIGSVEQAKHAIPALNVLCRPRETHAVVNVPGRTVIQECHDRVGSWCDGTYTFANEQAR